MSDSLVLVGGKPMFNWLFRIFGRSDADERRRFFETIDALNAEAAGGEPVATERLLGRLPLRSGVLLLADPQYVSGVEVTNVDADEVAISATLWQYPLSAVTLTALKLALGAAPRQGAWRKLGEVGIDSAKLIVADKADVDEHWTETGKDRVGVIPLTPDDDTVLRLLTKRFKLRTVRADFFSAEVIGPVSVELEAEIEAFLKSDPKYADYPFMHFYVQTNNSFDRAISMSSAWEFLPIGNSPVPLMFVCETGRGDGCYDVQAQFDGEIPRVITMEFIEN